MRDPGPRPTDAEMAQLVALLEERGLVEVYRNDEARRSTGSPTVVSG